MVKRARENIIRLLRWSEKYTKTDMVYLAHGGFWLFCSQAVAAVASFGLAVAFANLLPRETYGVYKYLLTILGILTLACLRGMDGVVTQASARGNDGTVLQALRAKMRWGMLGSLASLALALYYYLNGNGIIALALTIASVFIPIMDPVGIYSSVLAGKRAFKRMTILDSGSQITAAIGLTIGLLFTDNVIALFALYCGLWTSARLISFLLTLRKFPPNDRLEPHAMSYGWHSSIINSSAVIISSLDAVLVFHYLGSAELAVYAFAMAPILQLRGIFGIITTLSTPKFVVQTSAEIRRTLVKRSFYLFLAGAGIALCYSIFAPLFYRIFFPQYLEAVVFSQVFALTIAFSLGATLISGVLNSRVTLVPKLYLYLWNVPSIVLGISAVVFIKIFGIWGAIAGQLLSTATGAMVAWFLWYTIRNKEFNPAKDSAKV